MVKKNTKGKALEEWLENTDFIITREQALEVEKRHFKKYPKSIDFIRDFLKTNYNIKSITDFICRLSEFDMTKELLRFKKDLQSKISDKDPNKVLLVYFAVKDFIRSKRLEILYKMKDNGVSKCKEEYPHWRVLDTIKNTKWKYMNKSFSYDNPIIDKFAEKEYKNIKEASSGCGINIEYIKNNFGYDKRWAYISDYRQFQNCLPIYVTCPPNRNISLIDFSSPGCGFIFNNISVMCDTIGESEVELKKYLDKDRDLYGKYTLRTVSFEEEFRIFSPVIINGKEYYDATEASDELGINDNDILRNFGRKYMNYDIKSTIDESFITEDKQFPFESDKKFASEMYKK